MRWIPYRKWIGSVISFFFSHHCLHSSLISHNHSHINAYIEPILCREATVQNHYQEAKWITQFYDGNISLQLFVIFVVHTVNGFFLFFSSSVEFSCHSLDRNAYYLWKIETCKTIFLSLYLSSIENSDPDYLFTADNRCHWISLDVSKCVDFLFFIFQTRKYISIFTHIHNPNV